MVAFVGAPLITGGSLLLLLLAAPLILSLWMQVFDAALENPYGMPR